MNRRTVLVILLIAAGWHTPSVQALDQKTIVARTDHLRQMSQIERGRFERNLQEFQKLSDKEKQQYRQLHQELVEDNTRGGTLSKLVQTYAVWIQTLTPIQRDELQKETSLSQKLALIRRFKDEQDEPSEAHDQPSRSDVPADDPPPPVSAAINKREALSLKDLRPLMKILVSRLSPDKIKPEFDEPRLTDYVPIIHASVQSNGGNYLEWPSDKLLKDMTAALTKESTSLVNRPDYKSKREAMIRYLLMGIMKQARDSVPAPTDAEKSQIWEELSPVERERVSNMPRDRMDAYLVRKSMEIKGGDIFRDFKKLPEYVRQVQELFKLFEVSPPARFLQRGKKANERPPEQRNELKRPDVNRPVRNPGDK